MINSNFGFTPLREVWLGDCYPESYYDHLPNQIADPFRLITEWTKKDLTQLQQFLESRGIVVRRPKFESIDNFINRQGNLNKPPITPRDHYLVLGKTLYSLHNDLVQDPWQAVIDKYLVLGLDVQSPKNQAINCLNPPSLVRIGCDLYIDTETHESTWGFISELLVQWAKEYRVNINNTGGHSDGVFCPVAPGVIVSSHYKTDYSQSFPGWETYLVDPTVNNFTMPKNWSLNVDSVDTNIAFSDHINRHASDWVGNFKETVFEVNMLVIDQHNVIATKEHPKLFKFLESHGITAHAFDFRCRSFWDGGWHCLTLDIDRDDARDDLFPDRGDNGVYWRLK